jgi:hypothetical protein
VSYDAGDLKATGVLTTVGRRPDRLLRVIDRHHGPLGLTVGGAYTGADLAVILIGGHHYELRFAVVGRLYDPCDLFPGLTRITREVYDGYCGTIADLRPAGGVLPSEPVEPGVGGPEVAPCFVVGGPPRVADR